MNPYAEIFFLIAGFGLFHSLTAREKIKSKICSKLSISSLLYSFVRSLISLSFLLLSVVYLFENAPSTEKLFEPTYGIAAIIPALFAFWIAGMAFGQVARSGRMPQFFGLKEDPKVFFFEGAYSICRHPMYAGWLLASWGLLLSKPYILTLFYNMLLSSFVVYESLQEEKRMTELFGSKYTAYKGRTPFLFPYGFLKFRRGGGPR